MGTISQKLTYLNDTKGLIKQGINNLGGNITSQTTFRQYATELDSIYASLPKLSGSGSNISLSPTRKGRITSQINGDTFQQIYTGKNLFDKNSTPNFVDNGCTYEILNTGIRAKLTANSDGVKHIRYIVKKITGLENQKITAYAKVKPSENQNTRFIIGTCNNTGGNRNILAQSTIINSETTQAITGTIPSTLDSTNEYLYVLLYATTSIGVASGVYTDFEDLMVVKGEYTPSTIGDYEPYTGGIASPNPSYPQNIQSVTGLQTIDIEGKNLWSSEWEQGYINANGVNEASNNIIRTKGYISVIPNQHYAIKRSITGNYLNVRGYDKNKTHIGNGGDVINLIDGSSASNPMITTRDNCVISPKDGVYYLRFNDATNDLSTEYMMVKGDTPEDYVPYQNQTQTIRLGNIKLYNGDEIQGTPDNWVINRQIGNKIFTGSQSENWNREIINGNSNFYINVPDAFGGKDNQIFNNMGKYANNLTQNYNTYISAGTTTKYLNFRYFEMTSLTDFKNFLNTKNMKIAYILETPTTETITDTDLIEDLNNLYYAMSNDYTTNISVNGNLPMILSVSALKGESQ